VLVDFALRLVTTLAALGRVVALRVSCGAGLNARPRRPSISPRK
jgi:hypothetical protein